MGKQMEGDNRERRKMAKEARDEGKKPSEIGATLGASKQRAEDDGSETHQERIDQIRQGKHDVIRENTPEAKPGSRDGETADRERYPNL
jgi:hypothetical protein